MTFCMDGNHMAQPADVGSTIQRQWFARLECDRVEEPKERALSSKARQQQKSLGHDAATISSGVGSSSFGPRIHRPLWDVLRLSSRTTAKHPAPIRTYQDHGRSRFIGSRPAVNRSSHSAAAASRCSVVSPTGANSGHGAIPESTTKKSTRTATHHKISAAKTGTPEKGSRPSRHRPPFAKCTSTRFRVTSPF